MKRILIVINGYIVFPSIQHFVDRIRGEFNTLGIRTNVKTTDEIFAFVDGKGSLFAKPLPYDCCIYLDKDKYIASMLTKLGLRLFNSAESIELCDDKMLTYLHLSDHDIPMPKTISAPLCYAEHDGSSFIENLMKELSFPMVAKSNFGSMGKEVFLLQNEGDLRRKEQELLNKPRLYQEFISSSAGHDYRLILIGGKFFAGYRRQADNGDFRSNLAQGGHGEECVINERQIALAEKAANLLGLDYCGIDLLDGPSGESILCEVNSNAFIQGAEKITGKNIAGAYAKYIAKKLG